MSKKKAKKKLMPDIPPEGYKGSQADWMIQLQERGLWDGQDPQWHGDVMISEDQWRSILEACEGEEEEEDEL